MHTHMRIAGGTHYELNAVGCWEFSEDDNVDTGIQGVSVSCERGPSASASASSSASASASASDTASASASASAIDMGPMTW
jgi:hypothetical protein